MATTRFLLLDDTPQAAEAIQATLTHGGLDYELQRVDTRADFVTALTTDAFDLVLAAYAMPGLPGMDALELAGKLCPDVPFIFVSASLGEELAIEALKRGATDYVLKQRLGRLVPCVQRALREVQARRDQQAARRDHQQAEAALRQNETRLHAVAANLPNAAIFIVNHELRYLLAEGNALQEAGMTSKDLVGKTLWEAIDPALATCYEPHYRQALGGEPFNLEHCSHDRYYITHGTPLRNEQGDVDTVLVVSYDISERKRTELNAELLVSISQILVESTCVDEIVQRVGEQLHRYLKISICTFVEIDEPIDEAVIQYDWHKDDVPSLVGVYPLPEFVSYEFLQTAKAGQTIIVRDVANDPRIVDQSRFAALNIGAFINVPFIREGKWTFTLGIYHSAPYPWRADEIELMRELSSRVWERLERIRAEVALRESEARLRFMLDASQIGEWDLDLTTQPHTAYRSLRHDQIFGYETMLPEWSYELFLAHVHPDDRAVVNEKFQQTLSASTNWNFECRIIHPDQSLHWIWVRSSVYCDADGKPTRLLGMVVDITDRVRVEAERKQAETTLRESEELKQSILESSQDCIKVLTLESRISYISPGGLCLLEIDDPTSILDTVWADKWQGDDHEQAKAAIAAATRGNVGQFQGYLPTAKGTPKWWDSIVTPMRDAAGQVVQLVAISRDITAVRRTEAALRESEEKSRNILESITDGFFALDQDWRFTYVNPQGERLLARTSGDLLDKVIWEEYPNAIGTEFERVYRQTASERVASSFISFYPDHNCWYEVYAYPAADGITVYFRNVTDRIQAEADLRESEEKSRNVLESIAEAFFALDQEWRFSYMNQPGEALLDRPPGDLIGKNFWEEYPGVAGSEFETVYRGAMDDRVPGTLTAFYPDHNRWYDIRTYPAPNGITVYFNDVSDIKQAEADLQQTSAELERQLQRFDAIATSVPDFIYTFDRSGRFTYSNQQLLNLLQKTLAEVLGKNFFDLDYPTDLATRLQHQIQQVIETRQPVQDEMPFTSALGDHAYEYIFVPLFDANGAVEAVAGVTRDITERKRLLQQEQTAREEAERANRLKDEFLAVLSHELRSPLNPILGWTRLLQNGKLDAARQAEALKTIERNAKLQAQLIEDLLDISRIMQGKLTLTPVPTSLTFVISAALETVRLAAEAKHIQIMLDLPTIAPVYGDPARLQQVVWNLLTNAVKFTPAGGQVTVELRQIDRLAQLRVIDLGKGIQPQFLPHVFEYFRQEDSSTTRKFGGLGLGLAIVRQIVEMHGGTVWVESRGEHQGATFTVQLPLLQQTLPAVPEPAQAQAEPETPLSNLQILVVDDDADTRDFQAFVLQQSGAEVTAVDSGLEALQVLDRFVPDILVSDVGMAVMDGYTLMQHIRSRPTEQGGTMAAIALTAYAADVDQQKALQVGFQAYLTKPVEPEILVQAIVQLLQAKQGDNR